MEMVARRPSCLADTMKVLEHFDEGCKFSSSQDQEQLLKWTEKTFDSVLARVTVANHRDIPLLLVKLKERVKTRWMQERYSYMHRRLWARHSQCS